MKKGFRLLSMLLAVVMVMTLTPVRVEAKGAHLNKTKVTISVGDKAKLKVAGASGKIKWTTSKKSVATVTQKGVVKARKEGTAIVKAKIGKKVLKCKVIVEDDDDWDDEEDDTEVSEVTLKATSSLDKVKEYFKEEGEINGNGDYVISMDNGDFTYYIICDRETGALSFNSFFMGMVSGSLTLNTLKITTDPDMTGNAKVTESMTMTDYGSYEASGSFKIARFSSGSDVNVSVDSKEDDMKSVSDDEIVELSQLNIESTLTGCDLLLNLKTGYNLKDIGFDSFD